MNKTFQFFVDTTFRARSKLGGGLTLLLPTSLFAIGISLLVAEGFRMKPFEVKGKISPRPTHAQLKMKRKDVKVDEKIKLADEPIEMGKIRSGKTESLIKRSAIISFGEHWTLVPKKSLLNVPKHLANRVDGERKGKLLGWKDFYEKNRGWLQQQEVNIAQAREGAEMPEGLVKSYLTSGRVVVAVCRGGPISLKAPEEEEEPAKLVQKAEKAPLKPGRYTPALK